MTSSKQVRKNTHDLIDRSRERRNVKDRNDLSNGLRIREPHQQIDDHTQQNRASYLCTDPNACRIILGVDPGTVVTGYALIAVKSNRISPIDFGCIRPPKNDLLSLRYYIIFKSLLHLIVLHGATEMAIETPFMDKNAQSAIKLGSALGCAIIAAKEHGLPIFPYTPREVKQGITRDGGATKDQVASFIKAQLRISDEKMRLDATDALSIAVHHSRNPVGKNLQTAKEL
jgi:crossover junction endodeoxyribonuclease RuvC